MSGDSRKDYILATIGNHFGYSVSDGAVVHIAQSQEINTFLDDGNCPLLAARPELLEGVKLIQVMLSSDVNILTLCTLYYTISIVCLKLFSFSIIRYITTLIQTPAEITGSSYSSSTHPLSLQTISILIL